MFVCLDRETTGLDSDKDEIIEFAIARFNFDTIIDSFETLIEPSFPIPEESTAIRLIYRSNGKGKAKSSRDSTRIFCLLTIILLLYGITNDILS